MPLRPILVSACLLGLPTRYDGGSRPHQGVRDYLRGRDLLPIPVCPEQLSGLPTPRVPVRFSRGDGEAVLEGLGVIATADGIRMNETFLKGARETVEVARLTGCSEALLKECSPSCGVHRVYLGEDLIGGQGVTCALLRRHGLTVLSEEDL